MINTPLPSACRACRRRVIWIQTEATGKAMPLDFPANTEGNVTLVEDFMGRTRARVLGPMEKMITVNDEPGTEWWMPHHATCPNWLAAETQKVKHKR